MPTFLSLDDQPVRLVRNGETVFEVQLSKLLILYHRCNENRRSDSVESWFDVFRELLSELTGVEVSLLDAVPIACHVAQVAYDQKKSFNSSPAPVQPLDSTPSPSPI